MEKWQVAVAVSALGLGFAWHLWRSRSIPGTGAFIARKKSDPENWYVYACLEGSEADRAGIRIGDRYVAIDEKPTHGLSFREMKSLIWRKSGQPIRITVAGGEGEKTLSLVMGQVSARLPPAPSSVDFIQHHRLTLGMTVSRHSKHKFPSQRLTDSSTDASL